MVRTAVGFCPGHISGYFRQVFGPTPADTGSVGAGIVITEGVTATVVPAKEASIMVRRVAPAGQVLEEAYESAPLSYVLNRLGISAAITTECHLPISAGFGLSAAALLSTISALNQAFGLGLPAHAIGALAHEAEIVHRSGLGDVAACLRGGLVCRKGAGIDAPVNRITEIVPPIATMSFGPLQTSSILDSPSKMEQITAAYPDRCPTGISDFFALSRRFAERCGLISPEIYEVLAHCDDTGIEASMTMLGNGVFACGESAADVLGAFGDVYQMEMAPRGITTPEEEE